MLWALLDLETSDPLMLLWLGMFVSCRGPRQACPPWLATRNRRECSLLTHLADGVDAAAALVVVDPPPGRDSDWALDVTWTLPWSSSTPPTWRGTRTRRSLSVKTKMQPFSSQLHWRRTLAGLSLLSTQLNFTNVALTALTRVSKSEL